MICMPCTWMSQSEWGPCLSFQWEHSERAHPTGYLDLLPGPQKTYNDTGNLSQSLPADERGKKHNFQKSKHTLQTY